MREAIRERTEKDGNMDFAPVFHGLESSSKLVYFAYIIT
jgi:hypothetical protein